MPTVPTLKPDPFLPQFFWNERAGRYSSRETGRFVSSTTIRGQLDKVLDSVTEKMVQNSEQLRSGKITLAEWQQAMMQDVKTVNLISGAMAKGGWAHMTQSDFGRIGAAVKQDYMYLRNFAKQIASGEQKLDGTLINRTRLYGQAGRSVYHKIEQQEKEKRGFDEERSILNARDSCSTGSRPGCIEEAAKGWQPIGKMTPVGSRACLGFCRCHVVYRDSKTGEVSE